MARSRPKPLSQIDFKPWQTASRTNKERLGYVKIGNSLFRSSPFQKMKPSARLIYPQLVGIAGRQQTFTLSNSRGAELCGVSESTFKRSISELIESGFLSKCPDDSMAQFETSKYVFSDRWKDSLTEEERKRFTG